MKYLLILSLLFSCSKFDVPKFMIGEKVCVKFGQFEGICGIVNKRLGDGPFNAGYTYIIAYSPITYFGKIPFIGKTKYIEATPDQLIRDK